ncbi:MAG TPA: glycosyltransferase [Gemmatimonadaceae bacterium]|nr:glycosyltransferase [Gemmatimonadaceae bacterium]
MIVHDWVVSWAGAERCVERLLHVFPQADFVVGVITPDMREWNSVTRRARESWLGGLPGARRHHRWFLPAEGLAFASLDTDGYDLVLSSAHALAKAVPAPKHGLHMCYCHSPPRYLWDLHSTYQRDANGLQRVALKLGVSAVRWFDKWSAQRVDRFISNSRHVADRILRWYGRSARVVYPPVQLKCPVKGNGPRGDFLLFLGRLVPYKRVDLAIEAAARSGVKLVVAGDGPDRARLEKLAGSQVEFLGAVSEYDAGRLMEECRAFIFCGEEDFGIAPVEANGHGAPVIGYASGGLLETMIPGTTAEFFDRQEVSAVVAAIRRALARAWDTAAIRANARRFAPERFDREIRSHIESALRGEQW